MATMHDIKRLLLSEGMWIGIRGHQICVGPPYTDHDSWPMHRKTLIKPYTVGRKECPTTQVFLNGVTRVAKPRLRVAPAP